MISLTVADSFKRFIKPHVQEFFDEIGYKGAFDENRVMVLADVDAFKWKEDEFVWNQKQGNLINTYQVFFDGIFICYINDRTSYKQALQDFWRGFLKAYSLPDDDIGKIWLDKEIYGIKRDEQKLKDKAHDEEIIKAIKDKSVESEEQEIAKEIALDVATGK